MKKTSQIPSKNSLCSNQYKYLKIFAIFFLVIIQSEKLHAQNSSDSKYVYKEILQSVVIARNTSTEIQMREIAQKIISANSNELSANKFVVPSEGETRYSQPNGLYPNLFRLPRIGSFDFRDSNHVRFAYCAFDPRGQAINTRLQGQDTSNAVAFVIIAAGPNGRFDTITSCSELSNHITDRQTINNFIENQPNRTLRDDLFLIYTNEQLTFSTSTPPSFGASVNDLNTLRSLSKESGSRIGQIRLVTKNNQFFQAVSANNNQFNWEPMSGKWLANSEKILNQDTIELNLASGSLGIGFSENTNQVQETNGKKAILNIANHTNSNKYLSGIAFQNAINSNIAYIGVSQNNTNLFEIRTSLTDNTNPTPINILNFTPDGTLTIGDLKKSTTFNSSSNTFNKSTTLKDTLTVEGESTFKDKIYAMKGIEITGNISSDSLTVRGVSTFNNNVSITRGGLNVSGGITADRFNGDGENITNLQTKNLTGVVAIRNGGTGLPYIPGNNQILIGNGSGYSLKTISSTPGEIEFDNTDRLSFKLANVNNTPGTYGSPTRIPIITVDTKGRITAIRDTETTILPLNLYITGEQASDRRNLTQVQFVSNQDMRLHLDFNQFPFLSSLNQDVGRDSSPQFSTITANQVNAYLNGTAAFANKLNKCLSITLNYQRPDNGQLIPETQRQCFNNNDPQASFNFTVPHPIEVTVSGGNGGDASSRGDGGRGGDASLNLTYNFYTTSATSPNPSLPNSTITLQSQLFANDVTFSVDGISKTINIPASPAYQRASQLDQNLRTSDTVTFDGLIIKDSNNLFLSPDGTVKSKTLVVTEQATIKNQLIMQTPGSAGDGTISISGADARISIGNNRTGQALSNPIIVLDGPRGTINTPFLTASELIHTPKTLTVGSGNNLITLTAADGTINTPNLIARNQIVTPLLFASNQIRIGPDNNRPNITLDGATGTITTQNIVVTGNSNFNQLTVGSGANQITFNGMDGSANFKSVTIRDFLSANQIQINKQLTIGNQIELNAGNGQIKGTTITTTGDIFVGQDQNTIHLNASNGLISAAILKTSGNVVVGSGTNTITLDASNGQITANSLNTRGNIVAGSGTNAIILNTTTGEVITKGVAITSDARLKENILAVDHSNIIQRLENLHLYAYHFVGDHPSNRKLGVLAQEVLPLFPEAVTLHTDGPLKGYYAVKYDLLGASAAVSVGQLHRQTNTWQLHLKNPQTLSTHLPNFVVNNLTTDTVETQKLKANLIEADKAQFNDLEIKKLTSVNGRTKQLQAETMNSGQKQGVTGVGGSLMLFSASSDGHYLVNVSSNDGSYATATVFVSGGQIHVIPIANMEISIEGAFGNVYAVATGKSLKASWIRMG